MKRCNKCGMDKPESEFYKNRRNADGLHSYCKDCQSEYRREWMKLHPEKMREYSQRYRDRHPDELKERKRAYYRAHREHMLAYQREWYARQDDSYRETKRKADRIRHLKVQRGDYTPRRYEKVAL